jgi:Domain of unknown function (DUF1330)
MVNARRGELGAASALQALKKLEGGRGKTRRPQSEEELISAYFIVDLDIQDHVGFQAYARAVGPVLEKFGARYQSNGVSAIGGDDG